MIELFNFLWQDEAEIRRVNPFGEEGDTYTKGNKRWELRLWYHRRNYLAFRADDLEMMDAAKKDVKPDVMKRNASCEWATSHHVNKDIRSYFMQKMMVSQPL